MQGNPTHPPLSRLSKMEAILKELTELSQNYPYYTGIDVILQTFDHAKSTSENISQMEASYSKDQLTAAVYFIKSLHEDYPAIVHRVKARKSRTKHNLAGDIAIFIIGITPIHCQACKEDYIHAAASNSINNSVACFLCNRYSHNICYQKENIIPGLSFICTPCYEKNSSTDNPDLQLSSQTQANIESPDQAQAKLSPSQTPSLSTTPPPDQASTPASPNLAPPPPNRSKATPQTVPPHSPINNSRSTTPKPSSQSPDDSQSTSADESLLNPYQTPKQANGCNPDENEEKYEDWCKLYMENICPHGISGKGCSSTHPKRCNKYSKHGEDKYLGCRRGKNCMYFHPRLCRNSTEMKVCLAKTCKDVHLVGTQRFRPSINYHQSEFQRNRPPPEYQRQHHGFQQNQVPPWQRFPIPNHQRSIDEAERSQHFLVQYLENMRADLTKSLEKKIESVLHLRTEVKESPPFPAKESQELQLHHQNHRTEPTAPINPTLLSMQMSPNQFQPQQQPLNLSQPLQIQNLHQNPNLLQMY